MSSIGSRRSVREQLAVDELLTAYVEWREECAGIWDAHRRWVSSRAEESVGADCAYLAALDREEAAAQMYAKLVIRVASWAN